MALYSNVQSEAFELLTNFWNNIVDMLTLEFATTARGVYGAWYSVIVYTYVCTLHSCMCATQSLGIL